MDSGGCIQTSALKVFACFVSRFGKRLPKYHEHQQWRLTSGNPLFRWSETRSRAEAASSLQRQPVSHLLCFRRRAAHQNLPVVGDGERSTVRAQGRSDPAPGQWVPVPKRQRQRAAAYANSHAAPRRAPEPGNVHLQTALQPGHRPHQYHCGTTNRSVCLQCETITVLSLLSLFCGKEKGLYKLFK